MDSDGHKNRISFTAVLAAAVVVIATSGAIAQTQTMIQLEGDPFALNEFGAIIMAHDSSLQVEMLITDKDQRVEAYKDVDLRKGDEILMINGKRARSTDDIKKVYDALEPGDNITLAIKRDKDRMMVSFPKRDPDQQGGPHMMIRTSTIGDAGNITPVPGLGIMVSGEEGQVKVAGVLPMPPGADFEQVFKEGDVITMFQGKPVTSASDLQSFLDEIAVGDPITVKVKREDGTDVFKFAKPEAPKLRTVIKKQ